MTLGELIRNARIRAGLTQAQLAERSGVSQSRLAALESGTENGKPTNPRLSRLQQIATGLGVSLSTLVRGLEVPGEKSRKMDKTS